MRMLFSTLTLLIAGQAVADPPRVVVDTPVTASLVGQVTGDLSQIQILLPQGASAHHHQMRPSDARGLQDAALLIWTGPELTPWLDRTAASVAGDKAQLRLLQVPGTHLRSYGDSDGQGSQDSHDHDHAHAHADDAVDPHAWLDPGNAQVWLQAIAATLSAMDPDNAAAYGGNATAAAARIATLDRDVQAMLDPYRDARLVVFHDAYGYFTDHFGLRPAIPVSLGDASAPSAARLARIRDEIAGSRAICAFPEYGSDPALMQAVTEGSTLRIGSELSPEGANAADGPDLYATILGTMAQSIAKCLAGE